MPSPLYQQFQPQNKLMGMITKYRNNPIGVLSERFNIPQNISNPQDIVQHLLNSGQITQAQVDSAMRRVNDPMIRGMFK